MDRQSTVDFSVLSEDGFLMLLDDTVPDLRTGATIIMPDEWTTGWIAAFLIVWHDENVPSGLRIYKGSTDVSSDVYFLMGGGIIVEPGDIENLPGVGTIRILTGGRVLSDGTIVVYGGGDAIIDLDLPRGTEVVVPNGTKVDSNGDITLPTTRSGNVTTSNYTEIKIPRQSKIRSGEQTSYFSSSVKATALRTIFVGSSGNNAEVTYPNKTTDTVRAGSRILLLDGGGIDIKRYDGGGGGNGGSGCNAGFGALALAGAALAVYRRKRAG